MPPRPDQGGWGSASAPRPVEQLLGPGALWAGPYSLLGLRPGPVTDDIIITALDRRLAQIAASPLRDTPESDETRLALHAAAAQLLDPSVRRHLEARWSNAQPPEQAEEAPPAAAPAPRRSAAEIALEHDAVVTLGLYGGWNQRALRRLTMLAHARGLSSQAVAITLQRLASPRAATQLRAAGGLGPAPAQRTMREQLSAPDADEIDPATRIAKRVAIIAAALAGSIAASAILVAILLTALQPREAEQPQPRAPVAQQEQPPREQPRQRAEQPSPPEAPPPADTPDADAAIRGLRAIATSEAITPAEAIHRFDAALAVLEATWPDLTPSRRVAATDAVVEFLYRAAAWRDQASARQVAGRIARPAAALAADTAPQASDILPAIWSAGALSRLARERDLPASAQTEIRRSLADALGPRNTTFERSFDSGAAAAISIMADRLATAPAPFWAKDADPAAAWRAWQRAVDGLAASDAALRERLTLAGLESLLAHGPQPSENEHTFDIVRTLTRSLRWRPDGLARPTLLRWFDDRRMTAEDLHAVTNTLARASSAEGVDITMVVPIGASDSVRANHRSRYATAWGLGAGVDREQAVAGWFDAADAILAERHRTPTPADRLARAVRLSRLSEAASWAWRGQIEAADQRVATVDEGLAPRDATPTQWPQLAAGYTASRSDWAQSYLAAARNIPLRSARLDELLRGRGALHIVDAEIVATEALLGSPADIRRKAAEVLMARAGSAAVAHALLEALSRAPATRHASELISNVTGAPLPEPDADAWRPAATRALVEHLLEQIAAEGAYGRIDALADHLAASYAARAADRPDAVGPATAADADALAAALFTRWTPAGARVAMATSAPVPLPEIEARTGARLKLAGSTVERFCARQAGILELMALAVVIERPGSADIVTEILADASQKRARATHILEQVEAVEEAMLLLWTHRLGRPQPLDAPAATDGANL